MIQIKKILKKSYIILLTSFFLLTSFLIMWGLLPNEGVTIRNFQILVIVMISYLIFYTIIFYNIIKNILSKNIGIFHIIYIGFQIYNFISFVVALELTGDVQFNLKNFVNLNYEDKLLNIFFFPGSYFTSIFDCTARFMWACLGQPIGITILFNCIIFTLLGVIFGVIATKLSIKKTK